MIKLKNMLLATIAIVALTTSAFAGTIGLGVTGSYAIIQADGEETIDSAVNATNGKANVSNRATVGSIFGEYSFDGDHGMTFGVDWMPGSANVSQSSITRTDAASIPGDAETDDGSRTAQAEVENHLTYYAELPIHGGLYVKGGYVEMDVNTLESSALTTGSYGNKSVDGMLWGVGYKNTIGSNAFYKVEGTMTDFDTMTFASDSTNTGNSVKADLDVSKLTFALGFSF